MAITTTLGDGDAIIDVAYEEARRRGAVLGHFVAWRIDGGFESAAKQFRGGMAHGMPYRIPWRGYDKGGGNADDTLR